MQLVKPFITPDECSAIATLLGRKYAGALKQRYFDVVARKDTRGVYATVTLRNQSGAFFYPVEGRLAHADHDLGEREGLLFLLDYMEAYFAEFFREDGEVYLPIDWAEYESEGIPLQLKGQIFNLEVERMADELLARGGEVGQELH